jgi:hypothetical protein
MAFLFQIRRIGKRWGDLALDLAGSARPVADPAWDAQVTGPFAVSPQDEKGHAVNRTVLVFPVLPGKAESDIKSIAERFRADPEAYFGSRQRAGVTLERVYWQNTPMGDFVIAYLETERGIGETLSVLAAQDTELDRYFAAKVKEIHGVDITEPPKGPPPETVGEWVDPEVTERRRGMGFCAPLIPGQEGRGRAWAQDTFGQEGMTTSRRALGQNIEVVTLTYAPHGPVAGIYLEGDDPFEANRIFATSTEPFDVAFRQELSSLFPPAIDFNQPVPGITEIFDSLALPKRS